MTVLDFLYVFRGAITIAIFLVSFVLYIILRKKKLGKVFVFLSVISLALTVFIQINAANQKSYDCNISDAQAQKLCDYVEKMSADSKSGEINLPDVTVYNYEDNDEAQSDFDRMCNSYKENYGVFDEEGKYYSNDYNDMKVYFTPVFYYKKSSVLLPIASNYYIGEAYVIKGNIVFRFEDTAYRHSDVSLGDYIDSDFESSLLV